ncbi:Lrp/AsnC family transcriptional regulator [Nocardia terpenica]|uniref:Transcriptional regulator n=1 Tax=Nocardia terpenica TaxID=455432 RepID=A0A164NZA5_9NOCA|nr:Lrp/AsnC family transcriptional regulator [Nocardia terpenica]KZM74912.1 transcriptional regulator [Nocardia terpenica]MBF6065216.1 Lrp/AsnC family transcriptional regulator [Nocardia terpenica]MBF6107943.1 Lrp/AsnC family transcriptional regulator [Nocardia terpenica]MBF6115526.1 Lrp/AsnC family transcriptional regulator [Nocardia terpenica]MBF6121963.1 Lrp/AsnC family transcriptional regulator [Nocardia terpenica]
MTVEELQESSDLDLLDRQILHALVCDARIPFATLAGILGVSEQTVARRYRSMRRRGIVHVCGLVNAVPLGHTRWILRLRSTPDRALRLAESLARFPDVSWVSLLSTGSEVTCVSRPQSIERRDELLLHTLPRAAQLTGMIAHEVMHRFPLEEEWPRYGRLLTPEQRRALGERPPVRDDGPPAPVDLSAADTAMLAVLARDGRAPYAQLAAETGWSPTRVARRMHELAESGVLYFDLDFATEKMGYGVRASLWLRARPADLEAVGSAIAEHREVAFVAATTGPTNLMASIVCRDTAHLYRYVTERLGSIAGITDIEVTPALRTLKQAQALVNADRVTLVPEPPRR